MKIRLEGTQDQISRMLDFFRKELGSECIEQISKPYKNRNAATTYRVYVTLRY